MRESATRIVVAGGGTGGHVYPGLAIAAELGRRRPCEIRFVGTAAGLEARLVPEAGYPLDTIRASGLVGMGGRRLVRGIARLPLGFLDSLSLLARHQPHLVVGVGGYASGPVLLAAILRRVPTMIHEQNRWPGVTNRVLAPFVDRIALSFDGTAGRMGRRGIVTGNPVREEFTRIPAWTAPEGPARVLVFGGSRGARALNDAMIAALPRLAAATLRLRHQTGAADQERVARAYRQAGRPDGEVAAYLDAMPAELAAADLVVCRSGASTLAELAAAGRASILVPFPQAAHDHQRHNARAFVEAGAARLLEQEALDGTSLAEDILSLAADRERLAAMARAAHRLARPDAASRIGDAAEKLLGGAA